MEGASGLRHPALESAERRPLGAARADERQRLALLLQGCALLSHLQFAGWRLRRGWSGSGVDRRGLLRGVEAEPGAPRARPQEALARLARRLQRPGGAAPAGEGERLLAALSGEWRQSLVAIEPDAVVRRLLDGADFLWRAEWSGARTALAGEHLGGGPHRLWVAGPGWFRARLLSGCRDAGELRRRLSSGRCRGYWQRRRGASSGPERLRLGRFEAALRGAGRGGGSAAAIRVRCLAALGRLGEARRELERLAAARLAPETLLSVAEVAVRVLGNAGQTADAGEWVRRALAAGRGRRRLRAELLAAEAAWDRGDAGELERLLGRTRPALDEPELAWRWRHLRALAALSSGDGAAAAGELAGVLGESRRRLGPVEAAALWNEIGVGRALCSELDGAERAFRHAARLLARADGPRWLTLGLVNLAEVRLRRGRPEGVRAVLETSERCNSETGNWRGWAHDQELWARYEMVRGRPERALERVRRAGQRLDALGVDWCRRELEIFGARALGWLGRARRARSVLERLTPAGPTPLDEEEVPALWALAGARRAALGRAAGGAVEALWRPLLEGRPVLPRAWRRLDRLGSYRAARMVYDAERVAPGAVPASRLRLAREVLADVGAQSMASALDGDPRAPAWPALAAYLRSPGGGERLARLFRDAGFAGARLWWSGDGREHLLLAGAGGATRRSVALEGGRLWLAARRIEPPLEALFALARRELGAEVRRLAAGERVRSELIGRSPGLLAALARVARLAPSGVPVLVVGETGTGKELVARSLHAASRRRDRRLLAVNCAALSESLLLSELFGHARGAFTGADRDRAGVFEIADRGTVFLDEIGDLPLEGQGMLLRVLQESEVRRVGESVPRKVDVRVVAATHRDLAREVKRGRFREDLYYRLRVAAVDLPPLRERGDDVLLLSEHFLGRQAGDPPRLSAEARRRLAAHPWPGNVRELKNVLAVAAALADGRLIEARHLELPASTGTEGGYRRRVRELRRRLVREALTAARGRRTEAARRLGISRQALAYLIRTLEIE